MKSTPGCIQTAVSKQVWYLTPLVVDFQEVLPSEAGGVGGGDVAAASLKSFQKMMADYATLTHAEDVQVSKS